MPERTEERADWTIELAITQAIKAGVFRRAERLSPNAAHVWGALARPHTEEASRLLARFYERSDAGGVRPFRR